MGWSVHVESDVLPEPYEHISSISNCDGNFYTGVMKICDKQLRRMNTEEAANALVQLIAELDKGDKGLFSNDWCTESDQQWSKGRETREEWGKWTSIFNGTNVPPHMPFSDYVSFCGYIIRSRMRTDALRFYLYYKAGYDISYEW